MDAREKQEREKLLGIVKLGKTPQIVVTHITIRQSIFFLVLKLILIELLAAILLIFYLSSVYSNSIIESLGLNNYLVTFFILIVAAKTYVTFFIITQWLEEYYEITPTEIRHRNGFFFKQEERYKLDHIGKIDIEQDALGRIFNYGTIKIFDWALNKSFYLYLIHNPLKYNKILESLTPESDTGKNIFREKMIEVEE